MIKILILAVLSFLLLSGCTTQSTYTQSSHSEHSTLSRKNDSNSSSYNGYNSRPSYSSHDQQYQCSNIADSQAQALFNQGHAYLDRDGDGKPCEWKDKYLESQINQSTSSGTNCHSVRGYTRKNGTYVRGHTRCR